jgi:hypothetical protein
MNGEPEILMKHLLILLALTGGFFAAGPMVSSADACPMCKYANEDGSEDGAATSVANRRPRAYMYSILFMMSMPAIIFTGFGIVLYRLHRKHAAVETDPFEDD